jgi:hypothetical protein
LEKLSGILNPGRNKPLTDGQAISHTTSYLAFHDWIPTEDFVKGKSDEIYTDRYDILKMMLPPSLNLIHSHEILNQAEEDLFFETCVNCGEEGIVLKNPMEGWVAGHKGWRVMKRVRGVSYDLRCRAYEEGKGKMKGKVGNLFFPWKDGKEIKCPLGKGWTHADAEAFFTGASPIGLIFEVYALQESSKGVLRLPKAGELRHDKTKPDFGD